MSREIFQDCWLVGKACLWIQDTTWEASASDFTFFAVLFSLLCSTVVSEFIDCDIISSSILG